MSNRHWQRSVCSDNRMQEYSECRKRWLILPFLGTGKAVDNCCHNSHHCAMGRHTMSFALPETMRAYIDARVSAGNYGNTSEYIRDLVRRDQGRCASCCGHQRRA